MGEGGAEGAGSVLEHRGVSDDELGGSSGESVRSVIKTQMVATPLVM